MEGAEPGIDHRARCLGGIALIPVAPVQCKSEIRSPAYIVFHSKADNADQLSLTFKFNGQINLWPWPLSLLFKPALHDIVGNFRCIGSPGLKARNLGIRRIFMHIRFVSGCQFAQQQALSFKWKPAIHRTMLSQMARLMVNSRRFVAHLLDVFHIRSRIDLRWLGAAFSTQLQHP